MESLYQNCLKLNTYRFFVAEVPLLFEAGWQDFFDVVIYVESDTESNYARLNLPDFTFQITRLAWRVLLTQRSSETRRHCNSEHRNEKNVTRKRRIYYKKLTKNPLNNPLYLSCRII